MTIVIRSTFLAFVLSGNRRATISRFQSDDVHTMWIYKVYPFSFSYIDSLSIFGPNIIKHRL